MMCGAMLFGIIADKYGRRKVILTSAILNTCFGILTGFAPSYIWILVARTLVGFALAGAIPRVTRIDLNQSESNFLFRSTLMLEYLPSKHACNDLDHDPNLLVDRKYFRISHCDDRYSYLRLASSHRSHRPSDHDHRHFYVCKSSIRLPELVRSFDKFSSFLNLRDTSSPVVVRKRRKKS